MLNSKTPDDKSLSENTSKTNDKETSGTDCRVVVAKNASCYLKEIAPNSNTYWIHFK
jgi:hypothetical protein